MNPYRSNVEQKIQHKKRSTFKTLLWKLRIRFLGKWKDRKGRCNVCKVTFLKKNDWDHQHCELWHLIRTGKIPPPRPATPGHIQNESLSDFESAMLEKLQETLEAQNARMEDYDSNQGELE